MDPVSRRFTGYPDCQGRITIPSAPHIHRERERNRYWANKEEILQKQASWYRRNRERILARKRARREADPRKEIYIRAKARAKALGRSFTIALDDIVIPEKCPILGIPLNPLATKRGPTSPALDRIDSTGGYDPGNVAVISDKANTIKNFGTAEEHRLIAEWMEKHDPRGEA